MTGGMETLNKAGDKTWCHLHLHFTAIEARDTIARLIKRYLKETYGQQVTGVKYMYFMLKPDVARHEDEFFRYCLKQSLNKKLCYGFDDDTIQIYHQASQSSYLKCQEINQKKIDKSDLTNRPGERGVPCGVARLLGVRYCTDPVLRGGFSCIFWRKEKLTN